MTCKHLMSHDVCGKRFWVCYRNTTQDMFNNDIIKGMRALEYCVLAGETSSKNSKKSDLNLKPCKFFEKA